MTEDFRGPISQFFRLSLELRILPFELKLWVLVSPFPENLLRIYFLKENSFSIISMPSSVYTIISLAR